MLKHPRQSAFVILAIIGSFLTGCQFGRTHPPTAAPAAPQATGISDADLRDILADLGKAHGEKIRLSDWAGSMFLPVEPAFKAFFQNMSRQNKELDGELKAWAKQHHVDLKYHYTNDVPGRALKMMEDRQEKMIRADDPQNRARDLLMQMYNDYEWNLCQVSELLPLVRDPQLQDYLEKSQKMFQDGSVEIVGLLRHYKYQ
jgi:hypothetical protein